MRAFAAAALVGAVVAVLPATAALAADPKPDIAVTGAADKATYAEGETFSITVTVKNKGTVEAKHVQITGGDSEGVEDVVNGELSTGFDLAAGATKTFKITGKTNHSAWKYGHGFIAFELSADNGEAKNDDNTVSVALMVPGGFGDLIGYVFQGESSDAPWTPQTPGVQGVKVAATSADGKTKYGETVTDAKGRFGFTHLPAGEVLLKFTTPAGWQIMTGEGGNDDQTLAQIVAEQEDPANVSVPAKKVAVTTPSASASASASAPAGPGLPVTGDNTMLFVGAGVGAVVIGAVLVLVARRRRVHLQA